MNVDLNKLHMKGAIAEDADGKWGMVIDMDICTGCQACVAACAMENNIAYVGEEDAGYGRSMHWIRTERFWEGEYPEVKMTDYRLLPGVDLVVIVTTYGAAVKVRGDSLTAASSKSGLGPRGRAGHLGGRRRARRGASGTVGRQPRRRRSTRTASAAGNS